MIPKANFITLSIALLGPVCAVHAQSERTIEGTQVVASAVQSPDARIKQEAISTAKNHFRQGAIVAAEDQLSQLSKLPPRTFAWHREMSRRMAMIVGDLTREGQTESVVPVISRAVFHLQKAAELAQTNIERASISAQIGWIYERQLADLPKALEYYSAAAAQYPDSKPIQERVAAITARLAISEKRLGGTRK